MAGRKHSSLDRVLGRLDTLDSVNLANLVQRLARERGLFEAIFNTIHEGILVISADGAIEYANDAAARVRELFKADQSLTDEYNHALLGGKWSQGEPGLLTAVTICFIPIMDTIAAIIRRWRGRVSFFTPDRFHVHHKLLNLGFTTRQALAIIYALCVLVGAAALSSIYLRGLTAFILMLLACAAVTIFFIILHYLKESQVKLINK